MLTLGSKPGRARKSPVEAAIGYPACSNCGALRGDPCRTPGWKTRLPHAARDEAAARLGIPPWWGAGEASEGDLGAASASVYGEASEGDARIGSGR